MSVDNFLVNFFLSKELWLIEQFIDDLWSLPTGWWHFSGLLVPNACTSCARGSRFKPCGRTVGIHPVSWYQLGSYDKAANPGTECQNYAAVDNRHAYHMLPQTEKLSDRPLHGLSSPGFIYYFYMAFQVVVSSYVVLILYTDILLPKYMLVVVNFLCIHYYLLVWIVRLFSKDCQVIKQPP